MQIDLSDNTLLIAKSQATAAGFLDVNDYIANLIACQQIESPHSGLTRDQALEQLRHLRREVPKIGSEEIVDMVRESRADLS